MDMFGFEGFEEGGKGLVHNGDKEEREEEWELEDMGREEAKEYRGVAARLNFLSLDCPDLQFPIKDAQRDMGSPKRGSWKRIKKIARYLVGRKKVVWDFKWQEEPGLSYVGADSDWGGIRRTGGPLQGDLGCWGDIVSRRGQRLRELML